MIPKKLYTIFQSSYTNSHSDFYRKFYDKHLTISPNFPNTMKEWRTIPLIKKSDITVIPFWERIFIPKKEMRIIRQTGGTTGEKPFIVPRGAPTVGSFEWRKEKRLAHIEIQNMVFGNRSDKPISKRRVNIIIILGDPSNLTVSAKLGKLFQINMLEMTPYLLIAFIPYLKKEKLLDKIKYICLAGELCSLKQHNTIKKTFPNAKSYSLYGITELPGLPGSSCDEINKTDKNWFHPKAGKYYWELVNVHTNQIITEPKKLGEIVITATWNNNALPLIRYRTGDMGKIITKRCACGSPDPVYEVIGKNVTTTKIKIVGGEIKIEEARRVIHLLQHKINSNFELHFFEIKRENNIKPKIVFKVGPRKENTDMNALAKEISKHFRISPTFYYADGVKKNIYIPMKCEPLEIRVQKKKEVLVHHR